MGDAFQCMAASAFILQLGVQLVYTEKEGSKGLTFWAFSVPLSQTLKAKETNTPTL